MEKEKIAAKFWRDTHKKRDYKGRLRVEESTILNWNLGNYNVNIWAGFRWLCYDPVTVMDIRFRLTA